MAAFQRNKPKKEPMPWRVGILDHHQSRPSKADRGEFPASVVKRLKQEAGGRCQACKERSDTQTHHVQPKGRMSSPGRGVYTNGMRVCDICHDRIQTNEDELQYWIAEYERRHGKYFWYDEQDWEEHRRRESASTAAEEQRKERERQIEPVAALLSKAVGRRLKAKELRAIETLAGTRHLETFKAMAEDIAYHVGMKRSFGYGQFDD